MLRAKPQTMPRSGGAQGQQGGTAVRDTECGGSAPGLCRAMKGCAAYQRLVDIPGGLEIVWRLQVCRSASCGGENGWDGDESEALETFGRKGQRLQQRAAAASFLALSPSVDCPPGD